MKKVNGIYVLDLTDIANLSTITEDDITNEAGENVNGFLYETAADTYQVAYDAHEGTNSEHHARSIRYLVETEENKRGVMLEAQLEMLRLKVYTSADMMKYITPNETLYVASVANKLRRGGLFNRGNYQILGLDGSG